LAIHRRSQEVKKLLPGGFIKEDVEYEDVKEDNMDSRKREKTCFS